MKEYVRSKSPHEQILMDGLVQDECKASLMQERMACRLILSKQSVDIRQAKLLALASSEGDAKIECTYQVLDGVGHLLSTRCRCSTA